MLAIGNRPLAPAKAKRISCKGFWLLLAMSCILPIAVHPQRRIRSETRPHLLERWLMWVVIEFISIALVKAVLRWSS